MTDYTLNHQNWQAIISSHGAELQSLLNIDTGEEYLWQGDAEVWAGRAPILFPIIGRLKDDHIQVGDTFFPLTKHGFVRTSEFNIIEQTTDRLSLQLNSSAASKRLYPYDFSLVVSFDLSSANLAISYKVSNSGEEPMFFTIGSHPAIRLPLENSKLEDYSIEFDQPETLSRFILQAGLFPIDGIEFLNNEKSIPLTADLFDQDALIFKNINSHKISVVHKDLGTRASILTGGAPHLGIWAKPGAAYVCIEPWFGYDDPIDASGKIEDKPGMIPLEPQSSFTTGIAIRAGKDNH